MTRRKSYTRQYNNIALLITVVFLMEFIAPSLAVNNTNRYLPILSGSVTSSGLPVKQSERTYILKGFTGNEFINDIESSLLTSRNFRDFNSMIFRIFNILIPLIGFGVFIYCLGYCIRKKKQHISILSLSIGGHSPPVYTE